MDWNVNKMLLLIPIVILIVMIIAVDHFYFTEPSTPQKQTPSLEQKAMDANATQQYLNRYIKK